MDILLADLTRKFPPKINNPPPPPAANDQNKKDPAKNDTKQESTQQGTKRPAETSSTGPAAKVRTNESNRS